MIAQVVWLLGYVGLLIALVRATAGEIAQHSLPPAAEVTHERTRFHPRRQGNVLPVHLA